MPKSVKLKMNASSGKIDLQCAEDFYEEAMEQCIAVISTFQKQMSVPQQRKSEGVSSKPSPKVADVRVDTVDEENAAEKPKKARAKSGKAPNYNRVDLNLTEEQARELRKFYEDKMPKRQNDIVCVVAHKLKAYLNKEDFSVDEIFSGIRLIPGVKTPKDIRAVFKNTMDEGNCDVVDGKFIANFATDDHVTLSLPVTKE